ncbi:WD40 repeat-like protein [Wallemia mellicola]|nr:WD40 repeat-like protein [Wallemia mellicola]TIB87213.1 WD40 repeat-like protein [Wallemia mellicola]TIC15090.1 WD40 repeat-like protein [Wallemia mellicola]TIC39866.1 WD40 repeat-like protein [Wallemia mellicola]TIC48151.1 WD40 repeat-like protein [Wallemia mellicola]
MINSGTNSTQTRGLREHTSNIPSSPISTAADKDSSSSSPSTSQNVRVNPAPKVKIKLAFDPHFFAPKDTKKRKNSAIDEESATSTSTSRISSIDNASDGDELSYIRRTKAATSFHSYYKQIRLGGKPNTRALDMSAIFLRNFRNTCRSDIMTFQSRLSDRTYAPPLTTTFIPSTQTSGAPVLVVGDEEGSVSFLDAQPRAKQRSNRRLVGYLEAHDNAIFDLKFSCDSAQFCTASADQEIRIWDTRTQAHVGTCHGHTGSIKALSWSNFSDSIFASAARDGSVRVWDTRTSCQKESAVIHTDGPREIDPMLTIDKAHASASELRKRNSIGRSVTRSVTSIAYLQHQDNLLVSAGSANGSVKLWDIRTASGKSSKSVKPASETPDMTENNGRPHGVSHLAADGSWLWTLCTNSIIYGYPTNNLTSEARIQLKDDELTCASFWVRMALSPDSRYLSCGSKNGTVFSWDISNSKRAQQSQDKAVKLFHSKGTNGTSNEVGSVDWADDVLASCSDDMSVRFWRPQP